MAKAKLRKKIPVLRAALTGTLRDHHRFLLRQWLTQLENVETQIAAFDREIERHNEPFQETIERLRTIPGVDRITASGLVAEIGINMGQFPAAQNLASWGGLCPGNKESAGKYYSGKTRKGNPWLRRVLCQAAWAASHTNGTYLSAQYRRLAAKRNKNRAIIAVAHFILVIAYFMIKTGEEYREPGGNYFERINSESLKRYLIKRLERLGQKIILEVVPNGA
jgi:transposase